MRALAGISAAASIMVCALLLRSCAAQFSGDNCDLCAGRGGNDRVDAQENTLSIFPVLAILSDFGITHCGILMERMTQGLVDTVVGIVAGQGIDETPEEICNLIQIGIGVYCGCDPVQANDRCTICENGADVSNPDTTIAGSTLEEVVEYVPTCEWFNDNLLAAVEEGSDDCDRTDSQSIASEALLDCDCPTEPPTSTPTVNPTANPTATPTSTPTATPTASPSARPTTPPELTATPTASPTPPPQPSASPTASPTGSPVISTDSPTGAPSTVEPTSSPTVAPPTAATDERTAAPLSTDPTEIDCPRSFDACKIDDEDCCLANRKRKKAAVGIKTREHLARGEFLCRDEYYFGLRSTGTLHLLETRGSGKCKVLWTASSGNGAGYKGDKLKMQKNGKLVLFDGGDAQWDASCKEDNAKLQMSLLSPKKGNNAKVVWIGHKEKSSKKKKKKKDKKKKKKKDKKKKKTRRTRDWWINRDGAEIHNC